MAFLRASSLFTVDSRRIGLNMVTAVVGTRQAIPRSFFLAFTESVSAFKASHHVTGFTTGVALAGEGAERYRSSASSARAFDEIIQDCSDTPAFPWFSRTFPAASRGIFASYPVGHLATRVHFGPARGLALPLLATLCIPFTNPIETLKRLTLSPFCCRHLAKPIAARHREPVFALAPLPDFRARGPDWISGLDHEASTAGYHPSIRPPSESLAVSPQRTMAASRHYARADQCPFEFTHQP